MSEEKKNLNKKEMTDEELNMVAGGSDDSHPYVVKMCAVAITNDFSYFNGYNGKYTKGSIFVGNRTRKNLMANIKRVFENIPDQIKCEMYFRGMKIAYDIND
jgi:hypothetical protein